MSLREQPWWPEFLEALQHEPLFDLAARYQVDVPRVLSALVATSRGGSVSEEPWWPEAVRMARTHSIRQAARAFGTNPRRIRRGLAREGIRVGGKTVAGDGVPQLAPFRDRLGQEPDHVIADEAGLSVEAVQGERRRLGIDAFRPEPSPTPTPAAPAPDIDDEPLPISADDAPAEPRTPRRRIVRKTGDRAAAVVRRPASAVRTRGNDRVVTWSRTKDQDDAPAEKPAAPPPAPAAPAKADDDAASRPSRRGRIRIIRPDRMELDEPEPTPTVTRKRRSKNKASPHGEVREVKLTEIDLSELVPDATEPDAPRVVLPPTLVGADSTAAPADAASTDAAPAGSPSTDAAPAEAVPAEAVPAETAPADADAADADADDAPASAPAPRTRRGDAAPTQAGGTVVPLFPDAAPTSPAEPLLAWQVVVDGVAVPLVFLASNAGQAAEQALAHVQPSTLARASLRLVGPALAR